MRCKAMVHAGRIKIVINPAAIVFFETNYTESILSELKSFEPTVVSWILNNSVIHLSECRDYLIGSVVSYFIGEQNIVLSSLKLDYYMHTKNPELSHLFYSLFNYIARLV